MLESLLVVLDMEEGQYEKIVKIDENLYESAGPVLSEDKISKLNGN